MWIALIVDDDPHTLNVLRDAFAARGYQVVAETAGRAALSAVTRVQPHVVLIDVELSDVDGRNVVVALRSLTSAPIIALSTSRDPEEMVRILDAGADDHVVKPVW